MTAFKPLQMRSIWAESDMGPQLSIWILSFRPRSYLDLPLTSGMASARRFYPQGFICSTACWRHQLFRENPQMRQVSKCIGAFIQLKTRYE